MYLYHYLFAVPEKKRFAIERPVCLRNRRYILGKAGAEPVLLDEEQAAYARSWIDLMRGRSYVYRVCLPEPNLN